MRPESQRDRDRDRDRDFVGRFVDEARIASRVRHTNVVQTLDVVASDGELLLVLDYVHGESLARLRRLASAAGEAIPPNVASGIVGAVLRGLHAAHESRSAKGRPLALVHRDVTPQNIMVGADGVTRVLDFGIAQAAGLSQESLTRDVKGKLAYMPPEQPSGGPLDRRTDLFAVGVVLWEVLAGERLFRGDDATSTIDAIYNREPPRLSERTLGLSPAVDDLLARALAKDARGRFASADAMARAVEVALPPATDREIADWVATIGGDVLDERLAHVASFESQDSGLSSGRLPRAQIVPLAPESGTVRRDALIPPPLATSAATPRRNPRLPVPMPATVTPGASPFDGAADTRVPMRPLPTPLVMIAVTPLPSPPAAAELPGAATAAAEPDLVSVFAPSSGHTRIDPIERRMQKRAPLGVPLPLPLAAPLAPVLAPPETGRQSKLWIAMLLVAPPPPVLPSARLSTGALPGAAPSAMVLPESGEPSGAVAAGRPAASARKPPGRPPPAPPHKASRAQKPPLPAAVNR